MYKEQISLLNNFPTKNTPVLHTGVSSLEICRIRAVSYTHLDVYKRQAQKVAKIQQAHEEATQLEMPTLTMNLPIIATIVTLGTLTGLLGTVTLSLIHISHRLSADRVTSIRSTHKITEY